MSVTLQAQVPNHIVEIDSFYIVAPSIEAAKDIWAKSDYTYKLDWSKARILADTEDFAMQFSDLDWVPKDKNWDMKADGPCTCTPEDLIENDGCVCDIVITKPAAEWLNYFEGEEIIGEFQG